MTPPKRPSRATLDRIVREFNRAFPVGTAVMLRKDSGTILTKVRAPAEILSGHSAVGWFEGVSGCYSIENNRVKPAPEPAEKPPADFARKFEATAHLMPPPEGTCPTCGTCHPPEYPHNATSMYYHYRFYATRGRWPTWADAAAHCSIATQEQWKEQMEKCGVEWTAPPNGEAPVADPPQESIRQAVGFALEVIEVPINEDPNAIPF